MVKIGFVPCKYRMTALEASRIPYPTTGYAETHATRACRSGLRDRTSHVTLAGTRRSEDTGRIRPVSRSTARRQTMSEEFDPYHKWLGIPPKDQPPHFYRLLAIEPFESDPEVIQHAADQRMTHLRSLQSSQHVAHTQKLLSELAAASLCLLTPERKAAYDAMLKARLPEHRYALPTGTFTATVAAVEPVRVAAAHDAISPAFKATSAPAPSSVPTGSASPRGKMPVTQGPMASDHNGAARSVTVTQGAGTVPNYATPNHAARETLQGLNSLTFVDGPPSFTRRQDRAAVSAWRGPLGIALICGAIWRHCVGGLVLVGGRFLDGIGELKRERCNQRRGSQPARRQRGSIRRAGQCGRRLVCRSG